MKKNPYTNTSLGKSLGDVREKICKEMELAEPELIELLVATKIVGVDLNINDVVEQVWWPHVYKQRNPDTYEVPSIEEAGAELPPMNVTYRLAGIDGEATEDRIESFPSSVQGDNKKTSKYVQATKVFHQKFSDKKNGIQILLEELNNLSSLVKERYLAE
jgi:hypothetical protein